MTFWLDPQKLHIERARLEDADLVAKLHAQGFYRGWPREDFQSYIAGPDTPLYVACDAKRKIAGFAMLRIVADEAELITIAVDKAWRRKGVGRMLVRHLFGELLRTPARKLFLEVADDNPAALALYGRLGFTRLSERQGYYPRPDGTPATAIVMGRDLG